MVSRFAKKVSETKVHHSLSKKVKANIDNHFTFCNRNGHEICITQVQDNSKLYSAATLNCLIRDAVSKNRVGVFHQGIQT